MSEELNKEDEKTWYKPSEKLPKNREEILLRVKLHDKWNREVTLKGYRDFGDCLGEYEEAWGYFDDIHNVKYDFVDGEEVIAWCEIPLFKSKSMTEEQIKQIAEEYLQANYEEHPLGCRWFTHHEMVNIAIDVAIGATKELQEELEKWKDEWQEHNFKLKMASLKSR